MKRLSYISIILVVCLTVLTAITVWHLRRPVLNFTCSSWLQQANAGSDFNMTSNTLFTFNPNGTGFISMFGNVRHGGREYTLRRDYRFTYRHAGRNIWQLVRVTTSTAGSDDVPPGLLDRNFYSISKNRESIFIYIAQVEDLTRARVIGGLHSPAFMCISGRQ